MPDHLQMKDKSNMAANCLCFHIATTYIGQQCDIQLENRQQIFILLGKFLNATSLHLHQASCEVFIKLLEHSYYIELK